MRDLFFTTRSHFRRSFFSSLFLSLSPTLKSTLPPSDSVSNDDETNERDATESVFLLAPPLSLREKTCVNEFLELNLKTLFFRFDASSLKFWFFKCEKQANCVCFLFGFCSFRKPLVVCRFHHTDFRHLFHSVLCFRVVFLSRFKKKLKKKKKTKKESLIIACCSSTAATALLVSHRRFHRKKNS